MSKQALIDRTWQARLLTYRAILPPAAQVPALRPEPGWNRAAPVAWPAIAATALSAFIGFALGTALRHAVDGRGSGDDDIDWLSGMV